MRREITIEFRIDEAKASKIAERILDLFYNRKEFFKGYSMPEYILPRNLSKGSRAALFPKKYLSDERLISN